MSRDQISPGDQTVYSVEWSQYSFDLSYIQTHCMSSWEEPQVTTYLHKRSLDYLFKQAAIPNYITKHASGTSSFWWELTSITGNYLSFFYFRLLNWSMCARACLLHMLRNYEMLSKTFASENVSLNIMQYSYLTLGGTVAPCIAPCSVCKTGNTGALSHPWPLEDAGQKKTDAG